MSDGTSRRRFLGGAALGAAAVALDPVKAASAAPAARASQSGGQTREYWIVATSRRWQVVPSGHDDWKNRKVPRVAVEALTYVATEPNFGRPLPPGGIGDNTGIPGPVIRANPGDDIIVHFKNDDRRFKIPHTIHPHGVHYQPESDGTFIGKYTPPGGQVKFGQTFTYHWTAVDSSIGIWPYHDHGPFEMESTEAGLFGAIVITPKDEKPPDLEATIYFHIFNPGITQPAPRQKFRRSLSAINGHAFAGNTPTVTAQNGQDVAFNVLTLGSEFHTFHIHGHRWKDTDGHFIDDPGLGPAEGLRARFTEDVPGRWLYHCHLMEHMNHGMVGYYVVNP